MGSLTPSKPGSLTRCLQAFLLQGKTKHFIIIIITEFSYYYININYIFSLGGEKRASIFHEAETEAPKLSVVIQMIPNQTGVQWYNDTLVFPALIIRRILR
jgi:hypothetical protein